MKKVYLDMTQANMCVSVFIKDTEVIPAGTTIASMSVKHKNAEYQRFADEYDIHFIFDDNTPVMDVYTIPMVEVFAVDSEGGYIGSLGQATDLQADIPICYIDKDKQCYLIAKNGEEFLQNAGSWKMHSSPCTEIEVFASLEAAKEKYEFLDRDAIERELIDVEPT